MVPRAARGGRARGEDTDKAAAQLFREVSPLPRERPLCYHLRVIIIIMGGSRRPPPAGQKYYLCINFIL